MWNLVLAVAVGFLFLATLLNIFIVDRRKLRIFESMLRSTQDTATLLRTVLQEDREERTAEQRVIAEILAEKVHEDAATLACQLQGELTILRNEHATLTSAVEDGTRAAKEAQKEANHVNRKISDLNERLVNRETVAAKAQP